MESTSEVSNLVADVQDLLSRLAHVADPEGPCGWYGSGPAPG